MQFLNANMLWFLFALIIPIIIHLFYFRRYKKVFFSDTRFLHEAKEVQKNASRLKHLLILLSRLLAMGLIILAFAQPFRSADDQPVDEANHISVFIDNSFSMEASGRQKSLLDEAKSIAEKSIEQYPDHYSFHIFDHNFDGEDQQWIDKEKALNKIRRTAFTGKVKTVSQITGRARQMKERLDDQSMNSFIFTDGQKNLFADLPDFEENESIQVVRLNPVVVSNLAIDSAWIEDPVILPNQPTTLYVKLSNFGTSSARDVRLSFSIDGQSRPAGSYDVPAGQSTIDTIPLSFSSSGWKELLLRVEDESIQFDDQLLLTVPVSDRINILLVNENNHEPFFRAAVLGNQRTTFDRLNVQRLIYSDFKKYELIIIDGLPKISSGLGTELNNFIRSGGNVLFFPESNGDINSYNEFMRSLGVNSFGSLKDEKQSVLGINTSSFVFKNVYRRTGKNLKTPSVNKYFSVNKNPVAGKERLLDLRNRAPHLIAYHLDRGNFYLCTSPSDEASSDILSSGSFFVPMLHRMSTSSKSGMSPYYTIGSQEAITLPLSTKSVDPVYKLIGDIEVIPARYQRNRSVNLYAGEQIDKAGFYRLTTQDSLLAKVAYNFERSESDLSTLSNDEILKLSPSHLSVLHTQNEVDVVSAIINKSKNATYWKWCIILALLFLLIEQLLLRYFKT